MYHPNHHGFRSNHNTVTGIIQMYDIWTESLENKQMSGVMMVDLSAAFDMVDHSLLLEKLRIMGFGLESCNFFQSYLNKRSQRVLIDGHLSDELLIECGVPQGSILGPLLYVLYTNDLPEIVHTDCDMDNESYPRMHCNRCGNICSYADDSTYTYCSADPVEMSSKLTDVYNKISEYMVNNKLVINAEKTHLVVMGARMSNDKRKLVKLNAGNCEIFPSSSEKLLGLTINENMKFHDHAVYGKNSLVKILSVKANAILKISNHSTFKTRLMLANAFFNSNLIYMISVWGGTEKFVIRILQVIQNRVARYVTGHGLYTSTKKLLLQCNWLSVKQLAVYNSLLQVYKIISSKEPKYLNQKLSRHFPYNTRASANEGIRVAHEVRYNVTSQSFIIRAAKLWNMVPGKIRSISEVSRFKAELKLWVKDNVTLD